MDYQIVFKQHLIVLCLIIFKLQYALAIVNRDLVLTPKQGLQLSGKRIFYDENTFVDDATLRNNNSSSSSVTRPWERTLKHVTYLTLFTNAASGIITGNYSKVKEYNDFLKSPYIRSQIPNDSRFGDIVTLAQGRLESASNGSFRFVEGNCDYECARDNTMVAMWHVQKIRHRDIDRKFHYEMKFSVSPMTTSRPSETVVRGGPNKRTIMENKQHTGGANKIQTFIQKEDDYPLSFSKILSTNHDEDFADRRYDGSRNFRHTQPQEQHQYPQATPMPQPTFLRGVYRPPPPHLLANQPALPEHLNMGEYYKGSYGPKATPKIELFPNLLQMMFGKPQHLQKFPTTFRPPTIYQQMKFPRPEIYTAPPNPTLIHRQEYGKLPEYYSQEQQSTSQTPQGNHVITHHYHHHFFMANSTENGEHSTEHSSEEQGPPPELYKNAIQIVTPVPHFTQAYEHYPQHTSYGQQQQQLYQHQPQQQHVADHSLQAKLQQQQQQYHKMPPAPQKFVFPITQIEEQRVVHVTPVPTLRKPQYQQYYQPVTVSQYTTGHGPLVVYPAPVEEDTTEADVPTPSNKPFVESQPLEDNIRYSEPDPLYAHVNQMAEHEESIEASHQHGGESGEPQLEFPQDYEHSIRHTTEYNDETTSEHVDSVEAQVQTPHPNSSIRQNDEENEAPEINTQAAQIKHHYEQKSSHSTLQIATEKTTDNTIETEASNTVTLAATIKPKIVTNKAKRVRLKVTKLAANTTPRSKVFSTKVTAEKEINSGTTSTTTTTTTTTTSKPSNKLFVSTSTTESPLKSIGRYRGSHRRITISTTTTEKPILKWKPRRKETNGKSLILKNVAKEIEMNSQKQDDNDSKAKPSIREVTRVSLFTPLIPFLPTTEQPSLDPTLEMSNDATTSTTTMPSVVVSDSKTAASTTDETEMYEVLTQKSISKSVSYKIGEHGQEIPLIINEIENEVKPL